MNRIEHKDMEEALKESDERFRDIAQYSPNMIFINKGGRIVYVNKRCEDVMGYTKEEYYSEGFDFMKLIAPESKELVRENFKKHGAGMDLPPYEYKLLTKDGRELTALHTTRLIDYKGGKAILGIITDVTELKKTEKDLKSARELLQKVFDTIPDAVISTDMNFTITSCNQSVQRILGYTPDELVGKNYSMIVSEEMFKDPLQKNRQKELFEKGYLEQEDYYFKRKNGEVFPTRFSSALLRDAKGKPTGLVGTIRDTTERKKAEEALRESEEHLKVAQHMAHFGSWEWDTASNAVYWSDETYRIYGYEPHEISPDFEFVLKAMHPESLEAFKKALDTALKGKGAFDMEYSFYRKDGSVSVLHTVGKVIFDQNGTPQRMIGTVQDITDRKKMEERLKESQEFLKSIIENSGDAIVATDKEGKITLWSKAAEDLYGYKTEAMIGKTVDMLYPEELKEDRKQWQEAILAGETVRNKRTRIYNSSGELRNISLTLSPLRDKDGNIAGAIGVSKDITEVIKAEGKLQEKIEELEKWQRLTVGREIRMVELKKEIKELKDRLKTSGQHL